MAMSKRMQQLSVGTYRLDRAGNVTERIGRAPATPKKHTPSLSGLGPGYYVVDQHKRVHGGPYPSQAAATRKGNAVDVSFAVLHVSTGKKGKRK